MHPPPPVGQVASRSRAGLPIPVADACGAGSYGLKHGADRFAGRYVANGMLIAAALAIGFSVRPTHPGSPNAFLNISLKPLAAKRPAEAA